MIKRMLPAWAFLTLASSAQALQAPALFNHETVMDSTYQAHGRSTSVSYTHLTLPTKA